MFVEILDPAGQRLMHVDSPDRAWGKERAIVVTESAGTYRAKVTATAPRSRSNAILGQYTVTLTDLRPPFSRDEGDVAFLLEAAQHSAGTDQAAKAIYYAKQALLLEESIITTRRTFILGILGSSYRYLVDYRKAIEYFDLALAVSHKRNNIARRLASSTT